MSLCVSIATSVACAVGFGAFYVEISLSSIEGINPIVVIYNYSASTKTLSCNTIKIDIRAHLRQIWRLSEKEEDYYYDDTKIA